MKITELLTKHTIKLNIESKEKENVIDEMVTVLDKAGKLNDRQAYKEAILNRESQSSTGIGEGIAIYPPCENGKRYQPGDRVRTFKRWRRL